MKIIHYLPRQPLVPSALESLSWNSLLSCSTAHKRRKVKAVDHEGEQEFQKEDSLTEPWFVTVWYL